VRQAEHDVSILDQSKQGEAYYAARGYQTVATYVGAGLSATNDHRPEFQRMIMAQFNEYQSKENAKHVLRAQKENARQGFCSPFGDIGDKTFRRHG